jgi:hypothetical protein
MPSVPVPLATSLDCTKYCALYMDAPRTVVSSGVAVHSLHLPSYFTLRFDIRGMTPPSGMTVGNLLSLSGVGAATVLVHLSNDGGMQLTYGGNSLELPSLLPQGDWSAWTTIYVTVEATATDVAGISVSSSATGSIYSAAFAAVPLEGEDMELFLSHEAWPSAGGEIRNFELYGMRSVAPFMPAAACLPVILCLQMQPTLLLRLTAWCPAHRWMDTSRR